MFEALIVFEGLAVVYLCLFGSTEEPMTHFTEETRLWDQVLHTCGTRMLNPDQRGSESVTADVVTKQCLTDWAAGVKRRKGVLH